MFLRFTVIAALLFILGRAAFASFDLWENFAKQGNDDIFRLVMVRDLIAGQGWFDVVQYRVLPPDGMPLHWSRYVDAGLAALIVPLSFLVPMPVAELLAATLWPVLIHLATLALIVVSTKRLFGTPAACFAVACYVLWPVTGSWHAAAGNIDHHNVQMLLMTAMAVCAVWPDHAFRAGMFGGIAAAFSLAVGLETVPFVLGVGTILLARVLITRTDATRHALLVFCSFLALGSVVFWIGQTAPELRMQPMCDRLSTPILSVVWTAAIASAVPLLVFRSNEAVAQRLSATIVLTCAGVGLAWPMLSTCLAGPYGELPRELQDFIDTGVSEALPGLRFVVENPQASILFLPAVVLLPVLVGVRLLKSRANGDLNQDQQTALTGLWFLSVIGFFMMLVQMRATTLAASVAPILVGCVLAKLLQEYLRTRNSVVAFSGLVLATLLISPNTLTNVLEPFWPNNDGSLADAGECRTYASLVPLNDVPPGRLLTHFNAAPSVLWATHHTVLSGGYHTSAIALANSVTPFGLQEAALRDYLINSGATHFLLCANTPYAGDFVKGLAAGEQVDWLRPVPLQDTDQILLEIVAE